MYYHHRHNQHHLRASENKECTHSVGMVKSTGHLKLQFLCNTPASFCGESGCFCTQRNAWNANIPTFLALNIPVIHTENMLLLYSHQEDRLVIQFSFLLFMCWATGPREQPKTASNNQNRSDVSVDK